MWRRCITFSSADMRCFYLLRSRSAFGCASLSAGWFAVVPRTSFRLPISRFINTCKSMPSALILLSEGAEEIETVVVADVLTRGKIDVTIAGLSGPDAVACSRNVVIKPAVALSEAASKVFDVVILPGGLKGATNLAQSKLVGEILTKQERSDKYIACICAAPIALASHKIATGKKITSYPSFEQKLKDEGYQYMTDRVVVDNKIITSRGPGTAFEFALTILEKLAGPEERKAVEDPLLLH